MVKVMAVVIFTTLMSSILFFYDSGRNNIEKCVSQESLAVSMNSKEGERVEEFSLSN